MNRRYVKAGAAAAAAVLLAGGGATYAAFSDVETHEGNTVTAGELDIVVTGLEEPITVGPMYPGDEANGGFRVTYVDPSPEVEGGEPAAEVLVSMPFLQDDDDGCSTRGEALAEGGGEVPAPDCGAEGGGELGEALQLTVVNCDTEQGHYDSTLQAWHNGGETNEYSLGTLQPGDTMCVAYQMLLPNLEGNANDRAQGDTSTFTLDVKGLQVVSAPTVAAG